MQSVLIALMEVAATLASLDLVFLGIIFSAYQRRNDHPDPHRYRALATVSLLAFVVGAAAVALAAVALLLPVAASALLPLVAVCFFVQLAALAVLAVRSANALAAPRRRG